MSKMSAQLQLTAEETKILEQETKSYNARLGNQPNFNWNNYRMRWQKFVSEVAQGYDASIYDYTNDLSIRSELAGFISKLPKQLADKLNLSLKEADKRFLELTVPANVHLLGLSDEQANLWLHRLPIKPTGELLHDIRTSNIS